MHEVKIPLVAVKGRGALSRPAHRFDPAVRERFDDGWPMGSVAESSRTEIHWEDAKSALTFNQSWDIPFDRAINPYRGCEHGCIYCYARPTHSYLGWSPGLDFETRIVAKRNIASLLASEIGKPRYRPGLIVIGSATDCYQPIERELGLTRGVIAVLAGARHPFGLITKSSGVERDIDLMVPMARLGLCKVYVTITTLDATLARRMEPRAASPSRRLRVIRSLASQGIPVGVSVAPQIPFLNDDMEQVLSAARDAGASSAFYTVLRLPWELGPLFEEWLQAWYPQRAARVLARIRDMRGGDLYRSGFGERMQGAGLWADLLHQRFSKACLRLGYDQSRQTADFTHFEGGENPYKKGGTSASLSDIDRQVRLL